MWDWKPISVCVCVYDVHKNKVVFFQCEIVNLFDLNSST
jgi:hypothetical protein